MTPLSTTPGKLFAAGGLALMLALTLSACTQFNAPKVPPGAAAAEVRAQLGAPTEERQLAGGVRAWDYVGGPQGFTTYRVLFDSADRVTAVRQLLSELNFRGIQKDVSTRDDVLALIGQPRETMRFPLSQTEVWTYRYRAGTLEMLNDVHLSSATGRVLYYTLYRDPAYSNSFTP